MIIFVNGFDYTGEARDNMLRWLSDEPVLGIVAGLYPRLMYGWYVKQCRWMEKVEDGTVFH